MRPHPFEYFSARSVDEASTALADGRALPLGGGTDLLVWIGEGLATPAALVDLRRVAQSNDIAAGGAGIRIGASARLADISRHPVIRERYAALSQACESVGTPALRSMGTLGGNLCQRPRCWYLRRNIPCLRNGGSTCPAVAGENHYHAIFGGGPCYIVHPSDPAVALTALDAEIEVHGANRGPRRVPVADFYVLPSHRLDRETVLDEDEIVTAIHLPAASADGRQSYEKLMQRGAWDFALVSLAAARRADGEVRLVLGGVAPRPWRVTNSVEEDVASGGLDLDAAESLAERALYDARPLSQNGYKMQMARTLLVRAMLQLGA